MPETTPPKEEFNSLTERQVSAGQRDLAMQNQKWVIWKFGGDQHDIMDGEHPIGERLGVVFGFSAAAETARMIMTQDDTIVFIKLVPMQPNERLGVGDVYARRRQLVGSGRPALDPDAGRIYPKLDGLMG